MWCSGDAGVSAERGDSVTRNAITSRLRLERRAQRSRRSDRTSAMSFVSRVTTCSVHSKSVFCHNTHRESYQWVSHSFSLAEYSDIILYCALRSSDRTALRHVTTTTAAAAAAAYVASIETYQHARTHRDTVQNVARFHCDSCVCVRLRYS